MVFQSQIEITGCRPVATYELVEPRTLYLGHFIDEDAALSSFSRDVTLGARPGSIIYIRLRPTDFYHVRKK